jgi:uncharacterized protein (DUF2236 family)
VNSSDNGDAGLFGPGSVTWMLHGDPSMAVAGMRAMLLQATHPLVMAGFNANTSFKSDPWGRLQRTSDWVVTVTYGTTAEAQAAGARLRKLHSRLRPGVEPETGRRYRIDDPDLLLWVHCSLVESVLSCFRRSGGFLTPEDGDRYVDEMRAMAVLVGLRREDVPGTEAQLAEYYERVRPELRVTKVALRNVLWSFAPPMPRWVEFATPARPAWAGIAATAFGLLPPWARRLYGLPGLPTTDLTAALVARAVRRTALVLPSRLVESPAYRSAMQRIAA